MNDDVSEVPLSSAPAAQAPAAIPTPTSTATAAAAAAVAAAAPGTAPTAAAAAAAAPGATATPTDDLMRQFGLYDVLADMRTSKMRSSFSHYISELPADKVPLRPRCPAGSLVELARRGVDEDFRQLVEFEERVVRSALTLKEAAPGEKLPMPDWLDEEQHWGDDAARKKKRREKKKKKKKKKRKRGDDDEAEDGEKRQKKKRK